MGVIGAKQRKVDRSVTVLRLLWGSMVVLPVLLVVYTFYGKEVNIAAKRASDGVIHMVQEVRDVVNEKINSNMNGVFGERN